MGRRQAGLAASMLLTGSPSGVGRARSERAFDGGVVPLGRRSARTGYMQSLVLAARLPRGPRGAAMGERRKARDGANGAGGAGRA